MVKEIDMQKVGRNDPCPCGSGKKFKKCCEEKLSVKKKFSDREIKPVSASTLTGLFKSSTGHSTDHQKH
jgi:hypothetical protein